MIKDIHDVDKQLAYVSRKLGLPAVEKPYVEWSHADMKVWAAQMFEAYRKRYIAND